MPGKAAREEPHRNRSETALEALVGGSMCFLECRARIRRFMEYDVAVLISGETGTGKDLAARAIHYGGSRRDQPFVPVNCGTLPDSLIENELFGHEPGAYTDARGRHMGLVEQAGHGTLFLDEIETLSLRAQATLLRLLEDSEFRPLGGDRSRPCEARLLAASNVELPELVEKGQFRSDLFFRLNLLTISMPALRDRGRDALLLAEHFLQRFSARYSKPGLALHPDTSRWLMSYDWPGNVRELKNMIHREVLLAEGAQINLPKTEHKAAASMPGDVSIDGLMKLAFQDAKAQLIERFERLYLTRLMMETEGNVSRAARRAGKERRALGKLIKKHSIDRQSYLPRPRTVAHRSYARGEADG